jgi:sortase A
MKLMKKIITAITVLALCMAMTVPAFAYNYTFGSGPESGSTFGGATSTDEPISPDPMTQNTRRNKDNSALPPPYFYGSGDIPTDTASPYHDNLPESGFVAGGQQYPASGGEPNGSVPNYAPGSGGVTVLPSTSQTATAQTLPWYYENGSIGTIYVERTKKTITVYEGEDLANLKIGAGHFASTSAWDGNVAFCGHNRGNWPFFAFVKDLSIGDRVTYTTRYGTRTYDPNEQYAPPTPTSIPTPTSLPDRTGVPEGILDKDLAIWLDENYHPYENEYEAIRIFNEEREKAGLTPLALDIDLCKAARIKATEMVELDYFSHTSPNYGSPKTMLKTFGIARDGRSAYRKLPH